MKKQAKKSSKTFGAKPLGDRVFIREELDTKSKTASGIYIPDTVKEDRGAKKGVVVSVGEGRIENGVRIPISVSKGDTVLFQWGDKVLIQGEELYIVREPEIIAVIN